MELFLRSWWSKTYNRPLKDPLLETYTVYELMYEYFDKVERKNAIEKAIEQENDKIEEAKLDETLSWIEQEEKKEAEKREAQRREAENKAASENVEESSNQNDEQWMMQQLKQEYGDQFGEDIDLNLDE